MNNITVIGTITKDRIHFRDHIRQSFGGLPWFAIELSRKHNFKLHVVTNIGNDFPLEKIPKSLFEMSKIHIVQSKTTTLDVFPDKKNIPASVKNFTGKIRNLTSLKGQIVIISPLFQEISIDSIKKLREQFITVIIDIQGFTRPVFKQNIILADNIKNEPRELHCLCNKSDIIKFSGNEFNAVLPDLSLREKLKKLHFWGARNIIITQAEKGCLISTNKLKPKKLAVKFIKNSNTVGAGDKFLILLGIYLSKNNSFENSVIKAQKKLQKIIEVQI